MKKNDVISKGTRVGLFPMATCLFLASIGLFLVILVLFNLNKKEWWLGGIIGFLWMIVWLYSSYWYFLRRHYYYITVCHPKQLLWLSNDLRMFLSFKKIPFKERSLLGAGKWFILDKQFDVIVEYSDPYEQTRSNLLIKPDTDSEYFDIIMEYLEGVSIKTR
ncbi:MAG: hypothetical protein QW728_04455 [Thermoplasmata archaeon]